MNTERDVVYFGRTDFRGQARLFGIKREDRRQHTYILGKSGTGKTTLMHNMMVQDILNNEGVCVVDPHGEFVESLLEKIPESRKEDVVYFNPSDMDSSIGFNVLELPDPKYKHLVASGLMGIFTKIWAGTWSARMEYILNNCVLALLDTPGSTLLGITRLLVDKEFRQRVVQNIKDPVVRSFWVNEYEEWKDQFRNEAIAPIQNKVGQFLSTGIIRNIVGQKKSTLDILDIMNTGKIFLVNVSKGRIGEDNSALLGAMLITKIQLAAMERVRIPEAERVDFFLYVDEFQNFATDSFANILSEARKYRLDLTLAHQYVGQLVTDSSTKVRDAVFGNVGTMIMFRVGAGDAEFLEKEFSPEFTVQDMVNLPNRSIYVKLLVGGVTSRPFSASTLSPFKGNEKPAPVDEVIEISRRRYARPRWQIEREINEWSGMDIPDSFSNFEEGGSAPRYTDGPRGTRQNEGGQFQNQGYQPLPERKEYHEDLAAIGIEFFPEGSARDTNPPIPRRPMYRKEEFSPVTRRSAPPRPMTPRPTPETSPLPERREVRPMGAVPVPDETPKVPPISLRNLATDAPPSHGHSHHEHEKDVSDLKGALEEALKKLE